MLRWRGQTCFKYSWHAAAAHSVMGTLKHCKKSSHKISIDFLLSFHLYSTVCLAKLILIWWIISGLSQFLLLPQLPEKILLNHTVAKSDLKESSRKLNQD